MVVHFNLGRQTTRCCLLPGDIDGDDDEDDDVDDDDDDDVDMSCSEEHSLGFSFLSPRGTYRRDE